jgi:hypothetical protein
MPVVFLFYVSHLNILRVDLLVVRIPVQDLARASESSESTSFHRPPTQDLQKCRFTTTAGSANSSQFASCDEQNSSTALSDCTNDIRLPGKDILMSFKIAR